MKRIRILMGVLALAIFATINIACSKDKDQINQQQIAKEQNQRKPIATLDKNTGNLTYGFSIEELQDEFNKQFFAKDDDRFVLESVEVLDSLVVEDSVVSGLKFVVLDTKAETSISIWTSDAFIERVIDNDSIHYYLSDDITDGDFSFINYGDAIVKVDVSGFHLDTITPSEQTSGPLWCISCENNHCTSGCNLRPTMSLSWTCSECGGTHPDKSCITTINGGGYLDLLILILADLTLLFMVA